MAADAALANPPGPSTTLLARLRQGDAEGWQRFLDLYGPLIYSWCRNHWNLPPPDAADVMQDVALRVLQTISNYRGGNFLAWLWAITRSRALKHLKKADRHAFWGDLSYITQKPRI